MTLLTDEEIDRHLTQLGITHLKPSYTHIFNNNYAITDNSTFFLKVNTTARNLQIELESIAHLPYAPKPLYPTLTRIGEVWVLITTYIPNTLITPDSITEDDIQDVYRQLKQINNLDQNIYSNPRKLSETMNLVNTRLSNPNLSKENKEKLESLTKEFIIPFIEKYNTHTMLSHTDLKLENMLQTTTGEIIIIDFESIKPSPVEMDLASLYQNLYQTGEQKLFNKFYTGFEKAYTKIDEQAYQDSILFKNTLSTTAAITVSPLEVLEERIEILMDSIASKQAPESLPKIV